MELRKELKVPEIKEEKIKKLIEMAETLESKEDEDLLRLFNKEIGKELTRQDLHFSGSMSAETFVRIALNPKAEKMPEISYEEYLEIITRVYSCQATEWEIHYWLDLLAVNLAERNLIDLIYHPKTYFRQKGLPYLKDFSPKEILDYLLTKERFKPICLSSDII